MILGLEHNLLLLNELFFKSLLITIIFSFISLIGLTLLLAIGIILLFICFLFSFVIFSLLPFSLLIPFLSLSLLPIFNKSLNSKLSFFPDSSFFPKISFFLVFVDLNKLFISILIGSSLLLLWNLEKSKLLLFSFSLSSLIKSSPPLFCPPIFWFKKSLLAWESKKLFEDSGTSHIVFKKSNPPILFWLLSFSNWLKVNELSWDFISFKKLLLILLSFPPATDDWELKGKGNEVPLLLLVSFFSLKVKILLSSLLSVSNWLRKSISNLFLIRNITNGIYIHFYY